MPSPRHEGSTITNDPVILVDATAIPANRGGVGRYVDGLLSELTGQIEIACQQRDAEHFRALAPRARVLVQSPLIRSTPVRLLWEQLGLPLLARRRNAQVIHSPHYTLPLLTGRARVVTVHDATFFSDPSVHTRTKRIFFRWWTRISVRVAQVVVAPSAATASEVRRFTQNTGRFVVAHHGVDFTTFHKPTAEDIEAVAAKHELGDRWIAFLGTLEPRKNLPALVRAYAQVAAELGRAGDPVPMLMLAGGQGWDKALHEQIEHVASPGMVKVLGYVPAPELKGLLGGALFMVYPSLGEGFGLPVLEAMACGAPVITTRRLALPEVGGDAVEYAGTDDVSIAQAMSLLIHNPARRAQLAALGEHRAESFTWRACAERHETAYRTAYELSNQRNEA